MWICTNKAFLSVVEDRDDPTMMVVRARVEGHIEQVFPKHQAERTPDADYLFRAWIPRKEVAAALLSEVGKIDYDNFKNSVESNDLHDAYSGFWSIMNRLQLRLSVLTRLKAKGTVSKSMMARVKSQT